MERSLDIVPAYNPAAMEPAGGNQDIMPPDIVPAYIKRADRGQSCTSIMMPKPKGTGTTDYATLPKQTAEKAKEKKDTKRTPKTVQKKPVGKTVAVKKVKVQKEKARKTTPAKNVYDADDLAKFPGTSYRTALRFPPCTVYYDIPNSAWRIKAEPGSRRTELVKFTSDGNHSKSQWQTVVKKVKAYRKGR